MPRRLGDRRHTFVELQRYENACDGFNVLIALVLEITRTIACQRSTSVFPQLAEERSSETDVASNVS